MTPSEVSKHKGSILVIEDEGASLNQLMAILREDGYAVHSANEGELGLQVVKQTLPDLVLVAVSMLGTDGYQWAASMRTDSITRAIPVVFIMSIDQPINQAKSLVSGAVDYVTKPFDAEEVLWRIQTHISLRRLRENLEAMVPKRATQPITTNEELERALQEIKVLSQVTGRKHAEEKTREREAELRQVLDLAPQHIVVLGPEGNRLYSNQAALNYYGLTLEQWRSCDPRRLFHPDDCERMTSGAHIKIVSASSHEAEARLLRHDGKYHWFLFRRNPLRDGQGRITQWYVAATDIEDRKQAEQRVEGENLALRDEIVRSSMFEEIVGSSDGLRQVLVQVSKVAPTSSTVLILGETGTGKELIARAIHNGSTRSGRAFIRVNCAAIPPSLIASELFGHERGAFTGALQRRMGRFESAEGGTMFLDEIGELPADAQVALLRVLQEREFERVGGNQTIRVDVRVLAATNRDLNAAVGEGAFRQDLFYRLNVFPIRLPALRERLDDIQLLVEYLIDRYARKAGKKIRAISKETLELLQAYDWPGNIRELQNVIERAVIVCEGETFSVDETWLARADRKAYVPSAPLVANLVEREKEMVETALREAKGVIGGPTGAASKLGIPRQTLESKIRKLGINRNRFRPA
jgi:PAS domain S-box-containing protein